MSDGKVVVTLTDPDAVEITVTITATVGGWKRVRDGHNWNPIRDAIDDALLRVAALEKAKNL